MPESQFVAIEAHRCVYCGKIFATLCTCLIAGLAGCLDNQATKAQAILDEARDQNIKAICHQWHASRLLDESRQINTATKRLVIKLASIRDAIEAEASVPDGVWAAIHVDQHWSFITLDTREWDDSWAICIIQQNGDTDVYERRGGKYVLSYGTKS